MLILDIPFQVFNFAMLTALSEAVKNAGFPANVISRLFCGVTCGMIAAAVTCPIDVCKTRILARDKAALAAAKAAEVAENNKDLAACDIPSVDGIIAIESQSELLGVSSQFESRDDGEVSLLEKTPTQMLTTDATTIKSESKTLSLEVSAPVISTNGDENSNVFVELVKIYKEEGVGTLFLGLRQRLAYTGLANGIRIAAYGTSRMDLMMRSLDDM
jgi:hypothetical protein